MHLEDYNVCTKHISNVKDKIILEKVVVVYNATSIPFMIIFSDIKLGFGLELGHRKLGLVTYCKRTPHCFCD